MMEQIRPIRRHIRSFERGEHHRCACLACLEAAEVLGQEPEDYRELLEEALTAGATSLYMANLAHRYWADLHNYSRAAALFTVAREIKDHEEGL